MLTSQVKFSLLTREQVMGALKSTGSKDPDVLLAAKEEFASNYRPIKWFGIWGMVCGVLMTMLIVLAPLGIPLFFLGIWWFKRATRFAADRADLQRLCRRPDGQGSDGIRAERERGLKSQDSDQGQ
jgi:hypothetical protein